MNKLKNIAFIPAKGTSERVHAKNLRKINNLSLIRLAALRAIEAGCFDLIYIDTESNEIWEEVKDLNVKLIKRDPSLATNKTGANELLMHEIKNSEEAENYFILSCTTPLVSPETVYQCVDSFNKNNKDYDSVVTVIESKEYYWQDENPNYDLNNIPNSFMLKPLMIETHAVYGITAEAFKIYKRRLGKKVLLHTMPKIESIDIDTEEDLRMCEILSKG